jgi:hypothetical protein
VFVRSVCQPSPVETIFRGNSAEAHVVAALEAIGVAVL